MGAFTLDTSGSVPVPSAHGGTIPFRWGGLDPFTQGYIEALFASLQPSVGQPRFQVLREPDNGGWSIRDWETNRTVLIHSLKRSAEKHARGLEREETTRRDRGLVFSDLAPETLAAILKDCADGEWNGRKDALGGALFWKSRQDGNQTPRFPALTVYLGDDGKVYLREARQ